MAGLLRREGAPTVLSRKLWQQQFRGMVNAKRTKAALDAAAWRATEATIANLSAHGAVAVSQNALLGGPEYCFLKRKVHLWPMAISGAARRELPSGLSFQMTILPFPAILPPSPAA